MGGGDLNMKKSWHPVLLVNQEKVWKAEKAANEEKKKLQQLRKEQEEERQLAELQRMQEQATGRKRVEKVDWMYAAPGNEGGALGGHRLGEKDMEDYLLGKKRVDEVLGAADKNIGNTHKEFITVSNANNARDTAAKIREDPLLAIKRQELAQIEALKNRPDIRRKLKEMQAKKGESKEERKARRRAEKEDRRRERHERKGYDRDHDRDRYRDDSRSPRSDYSDERDHKRRRSDRDYRDDRDDRDDRRYRARSRSVSPKREYRSRSRDGDRDRDRRRRDESPRRRSQSREDDGDWVEKSDRIPPPRHYSNSHSERDIKPDVRSHSRPSAMDMGDRPTSTSSSSRPYSNGNGNGNGHSNGPHHANGNGNGPRSNGHAHTNGSTANNPLDDQRAARLAAMSASATELYSQRTKTLAERAETERREAEKEEKMRKKYGEHDVKGAIYNSHSGMNLSDSLSRRAGQGLQRDI